MELKLQENNILDGINNYIDSGSSLEEAGKVRDFLHKVNVAAHTIDQKVRDTKDYLTGKSDTMMPFREDATLDELESTEFSDYVEALEKNGGTAVKELKKNSSAKKIKLVLDVRKIPSQDLANAILPKDGKERTKDGKLYQYMTTYNKSNATATFILNIKEEEKPEKPEETKPADPRRSTYKDDPYADYSDAEAAGFESVMTPTPIPYKGYQVDKDGHLVKESWTVVDKRTVIDSDGSTTDYTWYKDDNGHSVFICGDSDVCGPENTEPDWETDSWEEANSWIDTWFGDGFDDLLNNDDMYADYLSNRFEGYHQELEESIKDCYLEITTGDKTYSYKLEDYKGSLEIAFKDNNYVYETCLSEMNSRIMTKEKAFAYLKENVRLIEEENEDLDSPTLKTLKKFGLDGQSAKFYAMMLGRLQADCEYFIGNGYGATKHLWAKTIPDQIELMYAMWDYLPEKPEWLSKEQIAEYNDKMLKVISESLEEEIEEPDQTLEEEDSREELLDQTADDDNRVDNEDDKDKDKENVLNEVSDDLTEDIAPLNLDDASKVKDFDTYLNFLLNHGIEHHEDSGSFKSKINKIVFYAEKFLQDHGYAVDLTKDSYDDMWTLFYHKKPVRESVTDTEKKVSFKDVHKCTKCGKSLSQCTCEISGEEPVEESLDEDMSGATQPASVGQHKIADISDDPEMKDLDREIKNIENGLPDVPEEQ